MNIFDRLAHLGRNRRGNVTMIFALSLVPIIAIAGFAIDTQMAFSRKDKIQYAIDSAVLAGARLMQTVDDEQKVRKHAQAYFQAMMARDDSGMKCELLDLQFVSDEELLADVDCEQPTMLMQIVGRDKITIGASSTATYGVGKLDVAFVFDISGSMDNEGRLGDLKQAAKDAADTLLPTPGASGNDDVRIAMASYNSMVDAGEFFEEVTGLKPRRTYIKEIPDTTTETREVSKNGWHEECAEVCVWYTERWGCIWTSMQCDWVDGPYIEEEEVEVETIREVTKTIESTCVYERRGVHAFDAAQPEQVHSSDILHRLEEGKLNAGETSDNEEGFMSAGHAYWVEDSRYSDGGYFKTRGTECRDAPPFQLSDNKTQIKKYIDDLDANGGTAGHQGIAWGWYLISHGWSDVFDHNAEPIDPVADPSVIKAMIIMTDGEFNSRYHSELGSSTTQAKALCDAIKDDDVIIYTVAFKAPEAGEAVLNYCASGPEFAFKAINGQQLIESYQTIATSISDLRIKH